LCFPSVLGRITDIGIKELAKQLAELSQLSRLTLNFDSRDGDITDYSLNKLSDTLKDYKFLSQLSLSFLRKEKLLMKEFKI
jgi:hypothetical protein